MPAKTWVIGEETLAADFNTYVQQQVIAQFSTAAARSTGLASPVRGQASYIATGDKTEGLEFWDGVAWRKPWNLPWGLISVATKVANEAGFDNVVRDIGSLSVTVASVPANRYLRVSVFASMFSTVATWGQIYITDAAGSQFALGAIPTGGVTATLTVHALIATTVTGSLTFKARVNCGAGNLTVIGAANNPAFLTVEDTGPATGTPTARPGDEEREEVNPNV